jgi:hypothetical protein
MSGTVEANGHFKINWGGSRPEFAGAWVNPGVGARIGITPSLCRRLESEM